MTTLVSDQIIKVKEGRYSYSIQMVSGTAVFYISLEGETFVEITDGTFDVSSTGWLDLPACRIKVVTTGDASVVLSRRGKVDVGIPQ